MHYITLPTAPMSSTTITGILILVITLSTVKNSQASSLTYPCQPPHHNSYPFCNTTLPIQTRAKSLISHLTLSEKITCLADNSTGIPRLGIPPYQWWSEALHGITANRPGVNFTNGPINTATMFPQVIVTTSSFNRTLWYAIASAIAVEARAMYNVGQAGLTFWAPTINVFRDPRWGRGQETPGEDPRVAGAYAVEFVTAFQGTKARGDGIRSGRKNRVLREGTGEDELMVSACCKHFSAYDLDNWGNYTRYDFNAIVTEQDMQDTYQLPFRSCIQEAKASCLMCSYNAINGIPACADKDLLQKARSEWDFKGYITSDCDAVATIYEHHNYTKTPEDAVAIALKAGFSSALPLSLPCSFLVLNDNLENVKIVVGTDLNCGKYMMRYTQSAIDQRKVVEEDIDKALLNLFTVQFRLGLFNGDPLTRKFGKLGTSDVCSSDHKNLALEAARQGIVLLKNDNKFLPLHKNDVSSLAVIGPMANATSELGGGYSGIPCSPTSILEGLKTYVKETSYSYGCLDVACTSKARFFEAVSISKEADFVIVVAGLDLTQENEEHDRLSLLLPGYQKDLITSIAATSRKPIVLVLTGGGPVDVSFAQGDPRIASIIWVGYPGEAGGTALAEVIFGNHNPGGKLPVTWYPESFTSVPMTNMNMRSDLSNGYPGRTYRFYTGNIVYGFGHGLSYTNYTYKFLSAPNNLNVFGSMKSKSNNILQQTEGYSNYLYVNELKEHCDSLRFQADISVTNHGPFDGSTVVMLFSRVPGFSNDAPLKQLVDFERVHTLANSNTTIGIIVDPCEHLSIVNELGKKILPIGDHTLLLDDAEHIVSFAM